MTAEARNLAIHEPIAAIPATTRRFARRAALLSIFASFALIGLRYAVIQPPVGDFPPGDRAFVSLWDPPSTKLETMIDVGDGQAWGALAQDPSYSHPEVFYEGTTEFVYRAQRPLPGWVLWMLSLGRLDLVGPALIVLTASGMGFLVWSSVITSAAFGRQAELGVLVGLLPGSVFTVLYLGPDLLVLGAALAGMHKWYGGTTPSRIAAIALFTTAALGRETLVLVPLVIGARELISTGLRWRSLMALAVPAVALGAWVVSLHQRYGYWPSDADHHPRIAAPFVGLWEARPFMGGLEWSTMLLAVGFLVVAFRRDAGSLLVWCAGAFIPVALIAGAHVWAIEPQRAFLPLFAFALLGALPFRATPVDEAVRNDHAIS